MKYIIMCGGQYKLWDTPRQLAKVNGEEIVARTIRLLRENGISDISISSSSYAFDKFELPVLRHYNPYNIKSRKRVEGDWCDAFYPTDEPTCYLFGDVVFSPEAIKTIIQTETDDIELFGSAPPFSELYPKEWIEPFALKVVDTKHLKDAIEKTKELAYLGKFWRKTPIMWELWTVIKDMPLQTEPDEYVYNYTAINDYTCDVDYPSDVLLFEHILNER